MRPGQNKRIRGRNNRKGPNPLTRSYESNGPDVKIRGTAQHIAEKYLQLARDAQSSGDTIMAESLLQHAEHYFRLIAAAQSAQQQPQSGYGRSYEAETDVGDEEDDFVAIPDRFAPLSERLQQPAPFQAQPYQQPQPYQPQQPPAAQPQFVPQPHFAQQPQPFEERPIGERAVNEPRHERQPRPERSFRDRGRDRGGDRNMEAGGERSSHQSFDRNRDSRRFHQRVEPAHQDESAGRDVGGPSALPSFITAPVRPVGGEQEARDSFATQERPAGREHEAAAVGYHLNARRRRRPRPSLDESNVNGAPGAEPPHSDELPLAD